METAKPWKSSEFSSLQIFIECFMLAKDAIPFKTFSTFRLFIFRFEHVLLNETGVRCSEPGVDVLIYVTKRRQLSATRVSVH